MFDERVTLLCDCAQKKFRTRKERKIEKFIEENNYLADFLQIYGAEKRKQRRGVAEVAKTFDFDEKFLFGWKFIQYEFF
ncbi:MAG: hypothetical protein L6V93_06240 [Clostridiales bacterium]|nr:MAG: hypothetical protein L6V93_06240 [Clostridiales bacterium]